MIVIAQPSREPVSITEVKEQIGIQLTDTASDGLIARRITEARKWAEEYTGRAFITQTREKRWNCFVDEHEIPSALTVLSVQYVDFAGVVQTLAPDYYTLDTYATIPFVRLAYGYSWPSTRFERNAVRIRYRAGYGATADAVEPLIREAIILLVGHWMNFQSANESGVTISRVPYAVRDMLDPYKLYFV